MRTHVRELSYSAVKMRGFTLVELLVTVAIMMFVVGSLSISFSAFDSQSILRARTHEVARTVRLAQTYATSIRGTKDTTSGIMFARGYGVSFNKTPDADGVYEMRMFSYKGSQSVPRLDNDAGIIEYVSIPKGYIVDLLCIELPSGTQNCNIEQLDISFKRPEFASYFYAKSGEVEYIDGVRAYVHIRDSGRQHVGVIEVGRTGYVSVTME